MICKINEWLEEDTALQAAKEKDGVNIFGHMFHPPTWPYIEPSKDAKANTERIKSKQTSQRRLHAELGQDFGDVSTEIVEDNGMLITKAMEQAKAINGTLQDGVEPVTWQEVLAIGSVTAKAPVSRTGSNQSGDDDDD